MTYQARVNWEYKVFLHDCYGSQSPAMSSTDEELNVLVANGWQIWKLSAAANDLGVSAVILLRRIKEA